MALAPDPASVVVCISPNLPESWDPLILLIDKKQGDTSFDVIRQLRRISPIRKIGHAGTLDPMATGLLICLSGKATKLMNHFLGLEKVYEGTIRLGQTTPSWDAETDVIEERDASFITDEMLREALPLFTGDIVQTTPVYSAVKVEGERLYHKARRGEKIKLPTRQVTIHSFDILDRRGVDVDFRVSCSSGTYIRSLAHELGEQLETGGHLVALRRTSIGPMNVKGAWKVDDLARAWKARGADQ